jgi:carbon monoxide dehydrogenase subunit G
VTTHVERSIEVEVPVRMAYDQWSRFEEFPRFMSGVEEVRRVGDGMTHWVAHISGVRREWDAAIVEQVPDEKVAWAATTGATNAGAVFFDAVATDCTRVRLTLDFEPEGVIERIGDVMDVVQRQAVADLDRFKEFIEGQGSAAGGWRSTSEDGGVMSQEEKEPTRSGTDEAWAPGGSGPGEDRGVPDTAGEGVVERDFADENLTTEDVIARDFANRDISGEGVVERDFANRDITERDIANRGIVRDEGDAHLRPSAQPHGLDALDAPGPADGIGAGLDPLDPRAGTADDPDNPIQPSV